VNAPSPGVLTWTVLVLNVAYVLLLASRMAASRVRGASTPPAPGPAPVAGRHVRSNRATPTLILIVAVAAVYYLSLLAWLAGVPRMGAALMETSWLTYGAGVLLSIAGLLLMGWTYAIFASWRWRAEVAPGHQLITRGPFRMVRHPIYLSFALFYVGAYFLLPYLPFLLHAIASFFAYDYRARTEEGVLLEAFGNEYRAYRAQTARYLPRVY